MRTMHKTFFLLCPLVLAMVLLTLAVTLPAQTAQWQSFGTPADGFRALFTAEPEISRSKVPVGGDTFELRSYVAAAGATALYIGVCDYGVKGQTASPDEMLSNAEKGAIEHASAHLLSEEKIDLNGNHGVELEAESDKLHFMVRMYLAGSVLYQTMVASPLNERFTDEAKFLDSFQLTPRPPASTAAPAADWKPYRYAEDRFSADFPSQPNMEKQNVSTDKGTFELRTYSTVNSAVTLVAAVCDYGASADGKNPDTVLDSAEKGAVTNVKAHLTAEKKIALGAYHGVEFEAESDSAHISARFYLVGTTLYQTIVASPLSAKYAEGGRFLDSFQLLDHTGK